MGGERLDLRGWSGFAAQSYFISEHRNKMKCGFIIRIKTRNPRRNVNQLRLFKINNRY